MRLRTLLGSASILLLLLGVACQPAGTATPTVGSTATTASTAEATTTTEPTEEMETSTPEMTATAERTATAESTTTPEVTVTLTATLTSEDLLMHGEEVYSDKCSMCHGENGEGSNNFPELAGNPAVADEDPMPLINFVVHGRDDEHKFGDELNDEDIAAVLSYIRDSWGNDAEPVTVEEVATVREMPLPSPTP